VRPTWACRPGVRWQDNPTGPHAVVWAGIISEKLTFAQYWNDRRFQVKKADVSHTPDNIYQPRQIGTGYIQVPNPVHGRKDSERDLRGKFVLVFRKTWHFSATGPELPSQFGFRVSLSARRGHRVQELNDDSWEELRSWLDQQQQNSGPASGERVKFCRPQRRCGARSRVRWAASTISSGHDFHSCRSLGLIIGPP